MHVSVPVARLTGHVEPAGGCCSGTGHGGTGVNGVWEDLGGLGGSPKPVRGERSTRLCDSQTGLGCP